MRGPQKLQPEEEEVKWEGGEELHEREAGGDEEEEKDMEEGCWNIRRKVLKGRQLRLPASFPRAASLPRRFGRSVTPTPAREQEVAQETADLNTESSQLNVQGSKKRAASTSPSRNEFRRSLKERLPRQLRSLLSSKGNQTAKLPPKPTRKAGPVGRTWVKVYDDITYMDDSAEEYYPALGYTGHPFAIPDAYPLPTPPTPPPVRQNFVAMKGSPTPSQISEYDNVPREDPHKELNTAQKQYLADQELILREISKQQMNEANKINVEQERPTVRKRENTRYKNRRQRRSPTPVADERMMNGYHDTYENQTSNNETFENIMYDHGQTEKINVVEDDYIVPERSISPPARPKRGMKIYETVTPNEQTPTGETRDTATPLQLENTEVTEVCEVASTTVVEAKVVTEKEVSEATIATQEEQVQAQPMKPVRGVKLYESVVLAPKESASSVEKTYGQEGPLGKEEEENVEASANINCTVTQVAVNVPPRPKRGVKYYEDVLPLKKSEVDKENVPPTISESSKQCSSSTEQSQPTPSKPVRGHKLYSSIKFANESSKPEGDSVPQNANGEDENTDSIPTNQEKPKPAERAPSYAQVHKGRGNQLKQVPSATTDSDTPPPIPHKKKSRHTSSSNDSPEQIPPRPSRHLKPRSRSTDAMNTSKRQRMEGQAIDSTSIDVDAPLRKPSRNSVNKASAPPRRKKPTAGGDPLVARMIIDTGKVSQVTLIADGDADSYENVTLEGETKINFRSRPLPPTPVETSIKESYVPTASTMASACPAVTPVASATSSVVGPSAAASAGSESVRVERAEPSSVHTTQHVSTADATVQSGCVAVVSPDAGAQYGKLEQDIDDNLKNIESSFATLDTVLKSLQAYSGPSPKFPRKSFDTSELIAAVENEQTGSVCSHDAVESSQAELSTPDKDGDLFVSTSDVCASGPSEQTCSEVNIVRSVPELFQGQLVSESDSQGVAISTECEQKKVAAVEAVDVQAAVVGDSAQTAESKATDVQISGVPQRGKQSAVEDKLLPEAVSTVTVTVDDSESVKECVFMNEIPEAISLSSEIVAPGRRLSIAAENITTDLEETFVTVESIPVPDTSDIATSAPDTTTEEGGRKISVAAETVVLEFMPESALNCADSADSVIINEIPEAISLSSKIVAPGRRLSIAAENITTDLEGTYVTVESIPVPHTLDIATSVPDTTTEEGGRKISVAAETVVLEFMPESAQNIADSADQTTETAYIVPSDEAEAVSVAAVSVTVGEFADTVTNTSNDPKKSSVATESVEENELAQPHLTTVTVSSNTQPAEQIDVSSSGFSAQEPAAISPSKDDDVTQHQEPAVVSPSKDDDVTQYQDTSDVPAAGSSADDTLTNEGSETEQLSAPNSLEGSQTSITDEDSVVSVVTKEELAARESEEVVAASSVDTAPPPTSTESKAASESVEITANSSRTAESFQQESVGLEEGVTSLSSRLEGINSFLDSLVRNFSSPTESGPLEETPDEFDQQSSFPADQLPCPTSNESSEFMSSVSDASCTTNPAPANYLSSSIVPNSSSSDLSSPEDQISNVTKNDATQRNETLDAHHSNEKLDAPQSNETLDALQGNETLDASQSNETLDASQSNETLDAQSNETLEDPQSHEALNDPQSHETLDAPQSKETLDASQSDEPLHAPQSNETFVTPQSNDTLDTPSAPCSVAAPEPLASERSPQAIGASVPAAFTDEVTEASPNAAPPICPSPSVAVSPGIFPTEVQYEEYSESDITPCTIATSDEISPEVSETNITPCTSATSEVILPEVSETNITPCTIATSDEILPEVSETNITPCTSATSEVILPEVSETNITPCTSATSEVILPEVSETNITPCTIATSDEISPEVSETNITPCTSATSEVILPEVSETNITPCTIATSDEISSEVSETNITPCTSATSEIILPEVSETNITPCTSATSEVILPEVSETNITPCTSATSEVILPEVSETNITPCTIATSDEISPEVSETNITPCTSATSEVILPEVSETNITPCTIATSDEISPEVSETNITPCTSATSEVILPEVSETNITPCTSATSEVILPEVSETNITPCTSATSEVILPEVSETNITPCTSATSEVILPEVSETNITLCTIATSDKISPEVSETNITPCTIATSDEISPEVSETNITPCISATSEVILPEVSETNITPCTIATSDEISPEVSETNITPCTSATSDEISPEVSETNITPCTSATSEVILPEVSETNITPCTSATSDEISPEVSETNITPCTSATSEVILPEVSETNITPYTIAKSDEISPEVSETNITPCTSATSEVILPEVSETNITPYTIAKSDEISPEVSETNITPFTCTISEEISPEVSETNIPPCMSTLSEEILPEVSETNIPPCTSTISEEIFPEVSETNITPCTSTIFDEISPEVSETNITPFTCTISEEISPEVSETNIPPCMSTLSEEILPEVSETNIPPCTSTISEEIFPEVSETNITPCTSTIFDEILPEVSETNIPPCTSTISEEILPEVSETNIPLCTSTISEEILPEVSETNIPSCISTICEEILSEVSETNIPPCISATSDEFSPKVEPNKKSLVSNPPNVTSAPPTLVDDCDRVVSSVMQVVTLPPPDTVFTMLNRGFGITGSESLAPGFVSVFIDGEWVRL